MNSQVGDFPVGILREVVVSRPALTQCKSSLMQIKIPKSAQWDWSGMVDEDANKITAVQAVLIRRGRSQWSK